jgi:Tfp pilus assembly protein PilO
VQVKAKNAMLSALVVLLVGALWYRVVYSPMESKASKAKTAAHEADDNAANLRQRIDTLNEAKKKAKQHEVAKSVMVAAIPADAAQASFLRAIDALRISSGADWQAITPVAPVSTGTITTINVSISVQGTEEQLMRYQSGLYDLKRIFVLDNLSLTQNGSAAAPGSAPQAAPGASFVGDQMQMQISGRIFSQPATASSATGGSGTSGTGGGATTPATGAPAPAGVQNN